MRILAVALLLALPALSGCLSFLDDDGDDTGAVRPADVGYDPGTIRVTDIARHTATIPSFDGTQLAAVAYEPVSGDRTPDGDAPRWGLVVFVHGWGLFKETYEGAGGASGTPAPQDPAVAYSVNRLEAFARNGLLAVAYDARGFGQSTGTATVAGPAEMADLDAVITWAQTSFPSNGLVGVVGVSYGGGHAYQAWADNPRVTTAVPMYGWVDLYDGLAPGNVPKAEWATLLGGVGVAGGRGRVSPMLAEWYEKALTRNELETVQAEMEVRSVAGRMGPVAKPLFACQGMQETLFPQIDRAWQEAGGFTRALVFTGGHGAQDETCWARTLDWFRFFLGGHATGVAQWPALSTVDVNGGRAVEYASFPVAAPQVSFLREPALDDDPSETVFTIEQRAIANPFTEPGAVWDQLDLPNNQVPEQFRDDPSAVFFDSSAFPRAEVLLGAPTLDLVLAAPDGATPFQVVGTLFHVDSGGKSRVLSRAAYAALGPDDVLNGTVTLRFDWVKANLAPGDKLVLKLGANDPNWFLPLLENYAVDFTGASKLTLPYYQG